MLFTFPPWCGSWPLWAGSQRSYRGGGIKSCYEALHRHVRDLKNHHLTKERGSQVTANVQSKVTYKEQLRPHLCCSKLTAQVGNREFTLSRPHYPVQRQTSHPHIWFSGVRTDQPITRCQESDDCWNCSFQWHISHINTRPPHLPDHLTNYGGGGRIN